MPDVTFIIAVKQFFGMKPDQKAGEFLVEVKQLTPQDRAELIPMLGAALGCTIVEKPA